MNILIRNGRIIDPATKTDEISDLYIEGGKVKKTGKGLKPKDKTDKVIDASGCYVMPGLIDLHVHLRDPGLTYKEDIVSGSKAAARGGFTTILAMPNTKPVIDSADRVKYVQNKAKELSPIHVMQIGAITKGQSGEELADIEEMIEQGVPAISEDGKSVMNARLYKNAMGIAAKYDIPVFAHCEDRNIVGKGCVNEDEHSREMGLPGISNAVEDIIAARDIILAKETGAKLHLCHCSTADSVEMIRLAKEEGLPVTGEVCPHHFTLSADDIREDDANFKMNPPLRSREDVDALRKGLKDGVMDVIATDHAPHGEEEKSQSMMDAPFGIVGLETSAALTYTELVKTGILSIMDMAEKMSYNPAKILGLAKKGSVSEEMDADLVVFDPKRVYRIDKNTFLSKGKNTPFDGREVTGDVKYTLVDGEVVYENQALTGGK